MDLRTYQASALETALPTARNFDYLIPGLIAEIGECFGKVAKARRDEWTDDRLNDELVKEWGDCAWMAAVALHVAGTHGDDDGFADCYTSRGDAMSAALEYAILAHDITTPGRELLDVWCSLRDGAKVVTGKPFDEVLQVNIDKLADRANRGVLGGSGDTR